MNNLRKGNSTMPEYRCPVCLQKMVKIKFLEEEELCTDHYYHKTGRVRYNVSHLECPNCFHKEAVDSDTFAQPWFTKT